MFQLINAAEWRRAMCSKTALDDPAISTHGHLALPVLAVPPPQVVLIGDGQVSVGPTIVKPNAKKIRRIGDGVVAGFAGGVRCEVSIRPLPQLPRTHETRW